MDEEGARMPGIWRQFRNNRRTLIGLQTLAFLVSLAVTVPAISIYVQSSIASSGSPVIHDVDLPGSLLRPTGLLLLLLLTVVWLTVQLLGYAAQLVAVHGSLHDEEVGISACLSHVFSRAKGLASLSLRFVLQSIALASPFLLLTGGVLALQLEQRGIPYYLTKRPPEFLFAVGLAALLTAAMVGVQVRHLTGWLHALPLFLFRDETPAKARRHSRRLISGSRVRLFLILTAWLLVPALLVVAIHAVWPLPVLWVAKFAEHRIGLLSLLITVVLSAAVLLSIWILFTSGSLFAVYHHRLFLRADARSDPSADDTPRESRALPWRLATGFATLVIALSTWLTYGWLEGLKQELPVAVIAHRGASSEAPENTLAAIGKAIEAGADWVEIDVQEHPGGEIYVFHDRDFKRLAGNPVKLRDADPGTIAKFDVGSWMSDEFSDQRVPTLGQVLELCRGKIRVLIEMKYFGDERDFEERVASITAAAGMADSVRIMSFDIDAMKKLRKKHPDLSVGIVSSAAIPDPAGTGFDFLAVSETALNGTDVKRARAAGMDVFVWTVNDCAAMSSVVSRGASGIITNFPREARRVLAERTKLNPGERLMIDAVGRISQIDKAIRK